MPAPTNTSATTATDLGTTLPVDVTQTADFAGTTYDLWFKRTVQTGETEWLIFGFGDLSVYAPDTGIYSGPDTAPVLLQSGGDNLAQQFSVTDYVGETLYLKFHPNPGNPTPAVLTLNIQLGANLAIERGYIGVNDDNEGFPAVFYHPTTDDPIAYLQPFPASDFCDVLPSGYVLALNSADDVWTLFNPQFGIITNPAIGTGFTRVSSNQSDKFYVANITSHVIKTVTVDGTVATVATLSAGPQAMAPSWDDSILYYVAAATTNQAVKRWDLTTDMALSDLVAGVANYSSPKTLLVLSDDTIIAGYRKTTATVDYFTRQYSAAGATLTTKSYGTTELNQMFHAIEEPESFWVWLFTNNAAADFEFRRVKLSDGSTLDSVTTSDYTSGVYRGTVTATPRRYGNSSSCQAFIVRAASQTPTTTYPIRRQRRFLLPSSPGNKRVRIPTLELLMKTGIGLTPGPSDAPVQGQDPQIMMRLSKDGGLTWGPERWRTAGQIGRYLTRVRWLQATGQYRNAVCEITVSDPVDWQFLAALAPEGIEEGSS